MSEVKIDKCLNCQVSFKPHQLIWKLGKKAHEKDTQYTLKDIIAKIALLN